jgi:hypothetical protein
MERWELPIDARIALAQESVLRRIAEADGRAAAR